MDLMRQILHSLDSDTLAYLEQACGDVEDVGELLAPFCEDLDVSLADRRRLYAAFPRVPTWDKHHDINTAHLGKTIRDFWGDAPVRELFSCPEPSDMTSPPIPPKGCSRFWVDGCVMDVENQVALPSWATCLFRGAWRQELQAWSRRLSSRQVAILTQTLGCSAAQKLAAVISTSDLDGFMCVAGGSAYLIENVVGSKRGSLESLKHACRQLTMVLTDADVDNNSYLDLLWQRDDVTMLSRFQGTPMEPWLLLALGPTQPRYYVFQPKNPAVKQADAELQQMWGVDSQNDNFRVAVVLDDDKVRQNLIYFYNQGWWLLASVDFCRHGDALPGHWHLNRTPTGERLEHWGPGGDVYHGTCWTCPLWWLVIPDGHDYLHRPLRLHLLPRDVFGDVFDER